MHFLKLLYRWTNFVVNWRQVLITPLISKLEWTSTRVMYKENWDEILLLRERGFSSLFPTSTVCISLQFSQKNIYNSWGNECREKFTMSAEGKQRGALPVIPTQTNFIAKARKRINAFIRSPAREERFYCNFYYNIAHISSPKKFLHTQI